MDEGSRFFLFGGGGGDNELLFFSLFPMCSHHVSNSSQVVPHDDPNLTSDLSHMVCPNFNSQVYKLKR